MRNSIPPLRQRDESIRFQKLLTAKKLKFTLERKQLLEEVLRLRDHFDADGLFAIVKESGRKISRDTVYRTMPLLLECGVIQKSVGDGRREYFERTGVKGHHDHIVCIACGRVIEFQSEEIERAQLKVCADHGFQLLFHDHRLFGKCSACVSQSPSSISKASAVASRRLQTQRK